MSGYEDFKETVTHLYNERSKEKERTITYIIGHFKNLYEHAKTNPAFDENGYVCISLLDVAKYREEIEKLIREFLINDEKWSNDNIHFYQYPHINVCKIVFTFPGVYGLTLLSRDL